MDFPHLLMFPCSGQHGGSNWNNLYLFSLLFLALTPTPWSQRSPPLTPFMWAAMTWALLVKGPDDWCCLSQWVKVNMRAWLGGGGRTDMWCMIIPCISWLLLHVGHKNLHKWYSLNAVPITFQTQGQHFENLYLLSCLGEHFWFVLFLENSWVRSWIMLMSKTWPYWCIINIH